jgi:hypothetical protein
MADNTDQHTGGVNDGENVMLTPRRVAPNGCERGGCGNSHDVSGHEVLDQCSLAASFNLLAMQDADQAMPVIHDVGVGPRELTDSAASPANAHCG